MTQGFSSADWDSVPNVDLDGRTINPYPTTHESGMSWAEYFAKMRAEQKALREPEPEDEDEGAVVFKDYGPVVVTQEAEEFDDPISALAAWVKRAHAGGWEILSIAHALSFAKGKPFGSGEKEGQPRPDFNIDTQWAHFKRGKDRASVIYTIVNGKTRGDRTNRYFNGEPVGDKEMQARMK